VLLKLGMTLDGRIATRNGQSQWITGPEARRHVQRLRQWTDAIMVGGQTVRLDNPQLTVRSPRNWSPQPRRIVWSSRTDLPADLHIWKNTDSLPLVVKPQTSRQWRRFLRRLADEQVTALLIEGGGELAAAALGAGVVDKIAFFIAPKILGGRGSRPAVGGLDPESLDESLQLQDMSVKRMGQDLLVTGYLSDVHRID